MKADFLSKPLASTIAIALIATALPLQSLRAADPLASFPATSAQEQAAVGSLKAQLQAIGALGAGSVSLGQIDDKTTWAEFSEIVSSLLSHDGIKPPGGGDVVLTPAALKSLLSASGQTALVKKALDEIRQNPERAAYLTGLYSLLLKPQYVNQLADGISKLFPSSAILRAAAPEIARALTIAVEGKAQYSLDARARSIGEAVSTLIYNLDPLQPERRQLVIDAVIATVSYRPKIDYTDTIVEIILRTAKGIGFPDDYLTALVQAINSALGGNAQLMGSVQAVLAHMQGDLSQQIPGQIIPQETPVINR